MNHRNKVVMLVFALSFAACGDGHTDTPAADPSTEGNEEVCRLPGATLPVNGQCPAGKHLHTVCNVCVPN